MQKQSHKKDILRDTSFFSGSVYVLQAMLLIKGFLNARILGPGMYGLWSGLNIILSYGAYTHIGVLNALNIEIPSQNGMKSEQDIARARNAGFTVCLANSLIFSFIAIVTALFLRKDMPLHEFAGVMAIASLVVISGLYEAYQTSLISLKKFTLVSKTNIIFSVLSVLLTILIVPRAGIYGVYIVAVAAPLLNLIYVWRRERYELKFELDFRLISRLIKMGFPIMTLNFLDSSITNIAGIIVLSMLGKVNMGYFAIVLLASRFLVYFPQSIHRSLEVRIYEKNAALNGIAGLRKYIFKPAQVMILLFPIILAGFYMLASFFIRHFLSQYSVAIYPFLIMLVGRFFVSFSPTSFAFITAVDKQRFFIPVHLIGILAMALSSIVFINMGLGITGAVCGTLLAYFFIGSVTFLYSIHYYIGSIFRCLRYLLIAILPLTYALAALFTIEAFIPGVGDILQDALRLALKSAIFLAACLPLVYIANVRTGIVSGMISSLRIKRYETGNSGAVSA